jgi:hypothetical protein
MLEPEESTTNGLNLRGRRGEWEFMENDFYGIRAKAKTIPSEFNLEHLLSPSALFDCFSFCTVDSFVEVKVDFIKSLCHHLRPSNRTIKELRRPSDDVI